jgi:hypothetical protein
MTDAAGDLDTSGKIAPADAALIAEIAPAMLAKLEKDGASSGQATALTWLIIFISIPPMLERQFPLSDWLPIAAFALVLLSGVASFLLPIHCKKRSVRAELKYRRVHGRWRWER